MLGPEECVERWNELKPSLDKVLIEQSDGEWTSFQILENVLSHPRYFHIWEATADGVIEGIMTTRVIEYNNFTSLHITSAAGDAQGNFDKYLQELKKISLGYENIDVLECCGRRGLVKVLGREGWNERYTTMRLNLKENNE